MAFERLTRCFLLLLFLGGLILVVNLFNMQTIPLQMSKNFFKGILYSDEDIIIQIKKNQAILDPVLKTTTTPQPNITFSISNVNNESKETRGKYIVLSNYIRAINRPSYSSTVTLCTQGTYDFLIHVAMLCSRWQAPVSVAVYAPGEDFVSAHLTIAYLWQCGPPCIAQNVTWHMIYDADFPPTNQSVKPINCSDSLNLTSSFKNDKKLLYPINVARNVARLKAETHYVFPSDIELYPSIGIVPRFLNMIKTLNESDSLHVYAIPVFEIKKNSQLPNVKSELVRMMSKGEAVFFHKYICDACQRFPKRDYWLKDLPPNDTLDVFFVTKRNSSLSSWEPIYICTNREPLYDERLSWEGKKDKMSQMYELCLMGYDVFILNNAFLVHAPGIKMGASVRTDHKRRIKYVKENNKIHETILNTLRKKYENRYHC
ncbi:beta-1,4-glucuronyltransferase 1-like [Centruroides sculpturatus]|uniref:beta-1,4-glucuronyltransferase 1-like n=1 Tax=Centruroides sculpturatus TaxID=218467 RepID=UPI000C6E078A|nr:beta-1,4-glucuronyltransferase 1-like [Centruroides sculpturatus]